jgi:glycosyltransferase involved in cell wall biosynthesis
MQVITRLNIGGPARHVLDLAEGLKGAFDVRVLAGQAPDVEGEVAAGSALITRVPLVRALDPRHDVLATASIRRQLARHKPALVHSHMAKAGTIARMAATTLHDRPRTVHTFHGHVLDGYFGPRAEQVFVRIERAMARRTDVLVAVSDEIRDALLDLEIGRASQYVVVTPGVDLDPFLNIQRPDGKFRDSLGVSKDDALVAVVARLTPIKDHQTAIEAIASLPGVHLALVGDGELRRQLHDLVATLGLIDRVHFTGWRTDLPALLADVDAVLLTSRNEGTPLALIEAAAAARPVIATDVGGVRTAQPLRLRASVFSGTNSCVPTSGSTHAPTSGTALDGQSPRRRSVRSTSRFYQSAEAGGPDVFRRS